MQNTLYSKNRNQSQHNLLSVYYKETGKPSNTLLLLNTRLLPTLVCLLLMLTFGTTLCYLIEHCAVSVDAEKAHYYRMRPSSLGGGRILRRTLSVRLSVRPVIVAIELLFVNR